MKDFLKMKLDTRNYESSIENAFEQHLIDAAA